MNLAEMIRAELQAAPTADPNEVAEKVAAAVPAKQLRAMLAVALRSAVQQQIGYGRGNAAAALTGEGQGTNGAQCGAAPRSKRWEAVKDWRQQMMNVERDGVTEWVFLRDCTRDDVLHFAAKSRFLADSHIAVAEKWEKVAALMDELSVGVVGDIPDDMIGVAL